MPSIVDLQHKLNLIKSQSESQAGQDLFVLAMSEFKTNGVFLELGCGHPRHNSNTWLLETCFGWSGISIDRQTAYEALYHAVKQPSWPLEPIIFSALPESVRQASAMMQTGLSDDYYHSSDWRHRPHTGWIKADAMSFDYGQIPAVFDYLQIDLDDPIDHVRLLHQLIVVENKQFATVTFEHDIFSGSKESQQSQLDSQQLLSAFGYELIANNVTIEPGKGWCHDTKKPMHFEDWWANPAMVPEYLRKHFGCVDDGARTKYYTDILFSNPTV